MVRDVLLRELDAGGNAVKSLGTPAAPKDATFTDNTTVPKAAAGSGSPGTSLLAAPADHVHPSPAPMRVAASGTTTIAANSRVTLATITRTGKEVFTTGGFGYVRDDVAGVTWENEVNGADHIALYHERTGKPNELQFRAQNASGAARTIDWATVALSLP
jgi:hypothetical protein